MGLLRHFRYKFFALITLSCSLLGVHSCTYYIETLESSVGDNYMSDFNYSRMVVQAQDAINHVYQGMEITNGPVISFDTAKTVKEIVLDYGIDQKEFYDGVKRRGVARVFWEGNPYLPGSVVNISFDNGFLCNEWYYDGEVKITYLDKNEFNQPEYLMETTGAQVKNASTQENYNWTNVYTRTKVGGDSTLKSVDDVWSISGTVYARNVKGRYYNAIIKDSLYFVNACEYGIVKGRVDIAPVDDSQRNFVLYGSKPVCDKWYTFKRGDRVITITKNR